ncbi:cytosolic protein [Bacillus suaedae]|uniref:Cytosolic protein n=1 Tax=Halalkalibacter suaedae TaxID=2822140 RepID=A0A940X0U9_9BACI|nr:cytosolic protein [Bacillus suaedae]MBP3952359.1 cytosolic protein [Bacillus suaedae]
MYVGRDMTELSMMSIDQWTEKELAYFHHSLQQMTPYLNAEGASIHREIILEIENRGGLKHPEATWTQGTEVHPD